MKNKDPAWGACRVLYRTSQYMCPARQVGREQGFVTMLLRGGTFQELGECKGYKIRCQRYVHNSKRSRIRDGVLGSTKDRGSHGAFWIPYHSFTLRDIASDGMGWEHVSVSLSHHSPNWREMCFIKDVFWD